MNVGSTSYYKHGKTDRFVRDLSSFGKRVGITIQGNRYKCRDCGVTFSETYKSIDERDKITKRLRRHIMERSLKEPFANIADEFSLSPTTIKRIFNEFMNVKNAIWSLKPQGCLELMKHTLIRK